MRMQIVQAGEAYMEGRRREANPFRVLCARTVPGGRGDRKCL